MKQWTCVCGSKVFVLTRLETIIVDFGKEGAIEGHPHIVKGGMGKQSFHCSSCGTRVPDPVVDEMLKEVI